VVIKFMFNSFNDGVDVCVHYLGVVCFKQTTESLRQGNKLSCGNKPLDKNVNKVHC